MSFEEYEGLFAEHRSTAVPSLWEWQREVLRAYSELDGDAAVELPTGTGKTLIGLLIGEHFRATPGRRIAYVAGNKQLAQQVERQARALDFPVVRFEGPKEGWDESSVRAFNFGQAIGVMNYWNYFNASPGVEPADLLILDDVHLLEGPLREMFTVEVPRSEEQLFKEILRRIVAAYPYYSRAEDLLNDLDTGQPPEMLAFPDSADLAPEIKDLLDASLRDGSPNWWAWRSIRDQLEVCCWIVSVRAVSFAPFVPPTQTLGHFRSPTRRLYLSATIGTADDLQRRLGAPPMTKLGPSVQPRQGERIVVLSDGAELLDEDDLVTELRPILESRRKALWLCARKESAARLQMTLALSGLPGEVRLLEGDNGADEPFAAGEQGHLVTAGRYDGMDFPGDDCRVEVVPEVPIATSDLEEFVSAFLRDAPFAKARFGQRVAQALGRCNRSEDDRAAYFLTDPEFRARFSRQETLDALPGPVRDDIYAALVRADRGLEAGVGDAERFLDGEPPEAVAVPPRREEGDQPETAADEVQGILALWADDFLGAAERFDRVAATLGRSTEYRGFWLALRALALKRAADIGYPTAEAQARQALGAAASSGGLSSFFTRLRHSAIRIEESDQGLVDDGDDDLFAAWDRLMDRYGVAGPQFDRWVEGLIAELRSGDHDTVARAVARVGSELLGLSSGAPQATRGEEDAFWEVPKRRTLTFEVKLAPKARKLVNDDVNQAEGAATAATTSRGNEARGILLTPYQDIDETAAARLNRVRAMTIDVFIGQVETVIAVLRDYRRQWSDDSQRRVGARQAAVAALPSVDWLWRATSCEPPWIQAPDPCRRGAPPVV